MSKKRDQRFVVTNGTGKSRLYLTNTGIFVRHASLARRFLSREMAEVRAEQERKRMSQPINVEPEVID